MEGRASPFQIAPIQRVDSFQRLTDFGSSLRGTKSPRGESANNGSDRKSFDNHILVVAPSNFDGALDRGVQRSACMKYFHVHQDDLAWLGRWLRSNLAFATAGMTLMIAMQYQPNMPTAPAHEAISETSFDSSEQLPAETELVLLTSRPQNPVAPEGWRRTRDGWEHVSTWDTVGQSINQLIAAQQEREPAWLRVAFAKIRRIPPLMIAMMQITAIAVIVNVSRSRRVEN